MNLSKMFLIILILTIVVITAGCLSVTYSDDYISFNSPENVTVKFTSGNYVGKSYEGHVENSSTQFYTIEAWPINYQNPSDIEEWRTIIKSKFYDESVIKTGNTTIDGINAAYVFYSNSSWYYVVKDGMTYQFMFNKEKMTESEIEKFLNSVKLLYPNNSTK